MGVSGNGFVRVVGLDGGLDTSAAFETLAGVGDLFDEGVLK